MSLGGGVSEATGQNTLTFALTNQSSSACNMLGYPGVSLVAADGRHACPDGDSPVTVKVDTAGGWLSVTRVVVRNTSVE